MGKGDMGTAVRAYKYGNFNLPVVLKIVRKTKLLDDRWNRWMRREIEVHRALNKTEGIVKLYEIIENDKYLVLVLEHCELGELQQYIELKPGRKLLETEARNIFYSMVSTFAKIHKKGIVHRDVKPDNFFLKADGSVRVGDFGQARFFNPNGKLMKSFHGN